MLASSCSSVKSAHFSSRRRLAHRLWLKRVVSVSAGFMDDFSFAEIEMFAFGVLACALYLLEPYAPLETGHRHSGPISPHAAFRVIQRPGRYPGAHCHFTAGSAAQPARPPAPRRAERGIAVIGAHLGAARRQPGEKSRPA